MFTLRALLLPFALRRRLRAWRQCSPCSTERLQVRAVSRKFELLIRTSRSHPFNAELWVQGQTLSYGNHFENSNSDGGEWRKIVIIFEKIHPKSRFIQIPKYWLFSVRYSNGKKSCNLSDSRQCELIVRISDSFGYFQSWDQIPFEYWIGK